MRIGALSLWLLIAVILCTSLSSCFRMGQSSIKLPTNPVLSGGLGWGVIKDAYVRLKASPSATARDIDHLRRGGVFALNARVLGQPEKGQSNGDSEASPTIWYGIASEGTNGWVRDSEIDVYASQAQAEKASASSR
jgi:hypothetical protein